MRRVWLLATATLLAGAAHAQPLTLADALARARASAPGLKASALQVEAARDAVLPAGALPDPKVSVGVTDFPISGPLAGRPDRDNFSMLALGYSQDVPNRAKRRARVESAHADISAGEAALLTEQRRVQVATAQAWIDLYYTQRKLDALDGLARELSAEAATEPARLAAGTARPSATLGPAQALAELADRRDALKAEALKARADLGRWIGGAAEVEPVGPPPASEVDPVELRANLDALPELQVKRSAIEQAEAAASEAKADKRPDWGYSVEYDHRDPRFGDYISGKVSFSLPLFAATRQDPMIASRLAQVNAALADREATRRELIAALDGALAEHVMHHAELARAHETLVPLAKQRADLERASFGGGTASLSEVLALQRAAVEAELTALDLEAATVSDGVTLKLTYGDLGS